MGLTPTVSALMALINELVPFAPKVQSDDSGACAVLSEAVQPLLLSPLPPHLGDELRARLGLPNTTYEQPWPQADEKVAAVQRHIRGKQIKRVIPVPGKLINIVVK